MPKGVHSFPRGLKKFQHVRIETEFMTEFVEFVHQTGGSIARFINIHQNPTYPVTDCPPKRWSKIPAWEDKLKLALEEFSGKHPRREDRLYLEYEDKIKASRKTGPVGPVLKQLLLPDTFFPRADDEPTTSTGFNKKKQDSNK